MAGTSNITGQDSIVFAQNASFDGSERSGALLVDGEIWMGSTDVNTLGTHVRKATIEGDGVNIAVTYSEPTDDTAKLTVAPFGGGTFVKTLTGGPGVTITGTAADPIVNSVVFTDTTATTLAVDQGYFATAAGTYNLPATADQGELIHIIADTAGAVVVDAPAGDFIRIGNQISSDGGTATSNAIGDQLLCRFRSSTQTWHCIPVGTWTLA